MGKWIIPYIKQYRGLFILATLLGSLTILFGSSLMFTSGYLISKASTKPESILMIYVPIVGVRAFGIGRAVLSYIERLTGHQLILKILSEMRVRLYKVLEPQAYFFKTRFLTGDLLGVLADDIEHLQDFYLKTLFPAIVSLLVYTLIILFAGAFSISFAIMLAVLIGFLLFVSPILSFLYLKAKNQQIKKGKNILYQELTDAIFGISDWLFSGRYCDFISGFEKQQLEIEQVDVKLQSFANWRSAVNQFVLGVVVIAVIYWASGMTLHGEFPATFIAACGMMMLAVSESFLPMSAAVSEVSSYQDSIKRLSDLESDQLQIRCDEEQSTGRDSVSIDFQHISFHYAESLISDFNLKVSQGEKIAILGPSGAGKSTILKLLQGSLEPSSGTILLNEMKASETISLNWLSVLNQKAYLFHTSILNNIRLGNPDSTDEEVYQAAEQVGLHDMIMKLPDGYETNMQETGQRFSGGERQRIALARVLLQRKPVVIMDEPTIGLDPITEKELLKTIFNTLKGKTIIWVTHHLAGMEMMDRILFLDEGKIVMSGTHQQLIENEERYRLLYLMDQPLYGTHKI